MIVKVPLHGGDNWHAYLQDTAAWAAIPQRDHVLLHMIAPFGDVLISSMDSPIEKKIDAIMLDTVQGKQGNIVRVRASMANVCHAFNLIPFNAMSGADGSTVPLGVHPGAIAMFAPVFHEGKIIGTNIDMLRMLAPDDIFRVTVAEMPEQVLTLLQIKPETLIDLCGEWKGVTHSPIITPQ